MWLASVLDDAASNDKREEELVLLARNGEEEAFSLLVSRCESMIRRQAARLRSRWMETEDLAQEGLLGLLSAVQSFQPEGGASFHTYAQVCIRNRMVSAVRRAAGAVQEDVADWEQLSEETAGASIDPVRLLDEQEDADRFEQFLQSHLTRMEYDVLFSYLNGYSYEEMASRMHVGVKTVDNALQRIRRKLAKRCLEEDAGE